MDKKDDAEKEFEENEKEPKKEEEYNEVEYEWPKDYKECDINQIINDISAKIVGQKEAISTIVSNIYFNQILIDDLTSNYYVDLAELDSRKMGIFLEGSTGTGKTAIVKEVSNMLDIPMIVRSANSFSETGYVGASITDILRKLYFLSGRNLTRAQRGVVFLDEVDKLASVSKDTGRDMKKGVQDELLGFIGGGTYDVSLEEKGYGGNTIVFDTSYLTFVLSGAWTDLREEKIRQASKIPMGFSSPDMYGDEISYTITSDDYVKEGLSREFFGRNKVLTCTRSYDYDDFINILYNSTISPLKNFEKNVQLFGYLGVKCSDEFINRLCMEALKLKTGARALQTIMAGVQNLMIFDIITHKYDFYEPITLTPDLIDDYNASLVRKVKRLK